MRRLLAVAAVLATASLAAISISLATGTAATSKTTVANGPWLAGLQYHVPLLTFEDCQRQSFPALDAEGLTAKYRGPSRSWYGRGASGASATIFCYSGPNGDVWVTIIAAHVTNGHRAGQLAQELLRRLHGTASLSWTGTWSTTYGDLILKQDGSSVTGTYYGGSSSISGTVSGRTLRGTWTQPGSQGLIEFVMSADGKSFTGKWSNNSDPPTATWDGTRK